MRFNWITALIIASALAILTLITFQVRWMQHSQELLEGQFNQQVKMALCNTVEKLAVNESCAQTLQTSCASTPAQNCSQQLDTLLNSSIFDETLSAALQFYEINLPYEASILDNPGSDLPPFSCTLNPLLASDDHLIQLDFDDKQQFILYQMGEMLGSSIFILLFICTIFGLATYHLLRQQKMSDLNREFFNHMAHEFRTPLTNIRLAGKMLQKKHEGLHGSPYLGIIHQEGNHLMHQVEQVLHLARLEKKDYQLKRQITDIAEILQETVQSMQLRKMECSADIELQLPSSPIHFPVDSLHLGNALRNLLDNSLKYCSEVPKIIIQLFRTEEAIKLILQDNGDGLDMEEKKKVFDKFYQSNHTQNRKGFGLGLAYVKRVIELHGGEVHIHSSKGIGTQFEISLPV